MRFWNFGSHFMGNQIFHIGFHHFIRIFDILEVQFHHEIEGGLSETLCLELFSRQGLYFHRAKNQPPLRSPSTFSEC